MVRRALKLNDQIQQLATDLKEEQSCLVFGRGRNYATAMEAALKVGRLGGWVTGGWLGDGCMHQGQGRENEAVVEHELRSGGGCTHGGGAGTRV